MFPAELKTSRGSCPLLRVFLLVAAILLTSQPAIGSPHHSHRGEEDARFDIGNPRRNALGWLIRSIDGVGNNRQHPEWGSAGTELLRHTTISYDDGFQTMAGVGRPGAREISNLLSDQVGSVLNEGDATDFVWQWGQFVDHDIDLTPGHDFSATPGEAAPIPTSPQDAWFLGTPIDFMRSIFNPGTSVPSSPRQQMNMITSFIDASNVYGSDPARAAALRENDGTGRLKTSGGEMLPFNIDGLDNAQPTGMDPAGFFLAGDVRANEQLGLTAMHTLFVREHNRLADRLGRIPFLSGDDIYEIARGIVGAQIQVITYREFIPVLLGPDALSPYAGYRSDVDSGVSNSFSTAAYRFGHSALSPELLRLNRNLNPISQGAVSLKDAFFNPDKMLLEGGIEPLLRGLANQRMQKVDVSVVDDVRNFLFGPPGSGGLDLASLNIQRGRDHGLPDYNTMRQDVGLARKNSFADITSDPDIQARLAMAYSSVDDIDAWVGGLAEDHLPGALVGELVFTILKDQFERLRDGDRFWYERVYHGWFRHDLERTTLSKIIRRNTTIGNELRSDVFRMSSSPPAARASKGRRYSAE